MSKKISAVKNSFTSSPKAEVKEEVKVEIEKVEQQKTVRPGSFASLISQ